MGAALRTPPYNLILSELDDVSAARELAVDAHSAMGSLPGLLAPREAGEAFVAHWSGLAGTAARVVVAERLHRAVGAELPSGVPGRIRPFEPDDRAVVLAWLHAFLREALPAGSPEQLDDAWLRRRLADPHGGMVLWDDGGPVSLAGYGNATPAGIRVGPVYTPPERRRRGYATALVATLTADLLERHDACLLFTDLANPASNAIYARIGYRPVIDVDMWSFTRESRR